MIKIQATVMETANRYSDIELFIEEKEFDIKSNEEINKDVLEMAKTNFINNVCAPILKDYKVTNVTLTKSISEKE